MWRWARSISVASRFAALVVAIGVVSLSVATVIGLSSGRDLTNDLTDDQLTGLRTSAASDVAARYYNWARSANPLPSPSETRDKATTLLEGYSERYIQPLAEVGVLVAPREIIPASNDAAIELQFNYSLGNELLANRSSVDDALDGSNWTEVHRDTNPVYRQVVRKLDLVDLLLVEPGGSVVYSVEKRPDLGTSLPSQCGANPSVVPWRSGHSRPRTRS